MELRGRTNSGVRPSQIMLWTWAKWLYPSECFGSLICKMGITLTPLRGAGKRNLNHLIRQVTVSRTLQKLTD